MRKKIQESLLQSGHPPRRAGGYVLGVDIGGSQIRAAIATLDGVVEAELALPTDTSGDAVVGQLRSLARRLAERVGHDEATMQAAVIGVPGVPDDDAGIVRHIPNVPALQRPEVIKDLVSALPVVPVLENDVNLAALGEWHAGGHRCTSLATLALGTGIGLGVVIHGQLLRGDHRAAGEIARLPFGGDPFDASTYEIGALESVVATSALVASYRGPTGRPATTGAQIFAAAVRGDARARELVDEYARNVALVVLAIRAVLDPGIVALTGGIGGDPYLLECVHEWLRRANVSRDVLVQSRLGARAGIIGALAVAAASVR